MFNPTSVIEYESGGMSLTAVNMLATQWTVGFGIFVGMFILSTEHNQKLFSEWIVNEG
jgi:hypothetical protein